MSIATQWHIQDDFTKGICGMAAIGASIAHARTTKGSDRGQ
jgi:hypothetical protein